jgi:hypothetical protein
MTLHGRLHRHARPPSYKSWSKLGFSVVAKKSKSKFDPEAFLAKADGGVTISMPFFVSILGWCE